MATLTITNVTGEQVAVPSLYSVLDPGETVTTTRYLNELMAEPELQELWDDGALSVTVTKSAAEDGFVNDVLSVGGGGASIGGEVTGATPKSVLYVDGAGLMAEDPDFSWDAAANRLVIGTPVTPEGQLDVAGDITAHRKVRPASGLDSFWDCGDFGRRWYNVWTYNLRFDESGGYGFTGFQVASSGSEIRTKLDNVDLFTMYSANALGYPSVEWAARWNNTSSEVGNTGGTVPMIRTFQSHDALTSNVYCPQQELIAAFNGSLTLADGLTVSRVPFFAIGRDNTVGTPRNLGVQSLGTSQVDMLTALYIAKPPEVYGGTVNLGTAGNFGHYAMVIDDGVSRFDGNGTYVFELPEDNVDPTGGGGAALGRIPVYINGSLRHIPYY